MRLVVRERADGRTYERLPHDMNTDTDAVATAPGARAGMRQRRGTALIPRGEFASRELAV